MHADAASDASDERSSEDTSESRANDRSARIARHAIVSGIVQGVAFRHYTKLRARELGVDGFVRNLADGSVEVWAEGPRAAVEPLLRWLERGPPAARVEHLSVRDEVPTHRRGFTVER